MARKPKRSDIRYYQDLKTRKWTAECPVKGCSVKRHGKDKGSAVATVWAHLVAAHGESLDDDVR